MLTGTQEPYSTIFSHQLEWNQSIPLCQMFYMELEVTDDPYSRSKLELGNLLAHKLEPDLLISKQCCGSGALMTSGSGIHFFRIPDPTVLLIFSESGETFFWVKKFIIFFVQ
jgi:hypothetical protein